MKRGLFGLGVVALLLLVSFGRIGSAQTNNGGFSLLVTPSPLVATLKPGQTTKLELAIRNTGTEPENLKVELRAFKINPSTSKITLEQTPPADVAGWVRFTDPKFSIAAGQWFTETISLTAPSDAGFSYSFAILISRAASPPQSATQPQLVGSVAVFTLLNIDRPGATRSFTVDSFSSRSRVYEYLPVTLTAQLKNTGNSLFRPAGSVFIERGGRTVAELPLNPQDSYLLPGVSRPITITWSDGFPVYQTVKAADNSMERQQLTWNWSQLERLRIGRYSAKLVGIYNDGQRDIPIMAEVSFWVMPWRLLLGLLVIIGLMVVGLVVLMRRILNWRNRKESHGKKYRL